MGTGYIRNDTVNNIADGNIINASDIDGEYDALQAAFDAATGHTHDGTTGEGAPIEVTGPAQEYVSTGTEFRPKANNTYDLGSSGNQWKDLYVDGTANLDAVDIDGGNIDGTVIGAATAAAGTFTNVTANGTINLAGATVSNGGTVTTVDINGGTIDGTVIGGSTPAAISGTTGTFSGNLTVDTNTLFVDASNNRVGIVTSSPATQLEVVGTIRASGGGPRLSILDTGGATDEKEWSLSGSDGPLRLFAINEAGGGSGDYVDFTRVGNSVRTIRGARAGNTSYELSNFDRSLFFSGGVSTIGTATAHDLVVDTNNTERMRITSTGSVGIGTSSPSAQLDVTNTSGSSIIEINAENNSASQLRFGDSDDADIGLISYSHALNTFQIFTNNAEAMRITSTGSVGIGTSSPASKFVVSGGRTDLTANSETYALGVRYSSGTGIYYIGASNSATPDLVFSQVGGSERVRFTNDGNVGIGTSSPAQKLVTYAASTNLEILNTVRNDNAGVGIAAIGFNVSASGEGDFTQAGIGFVRGIANGGGALAFYNKSDGATGNFTTANERMRIDASGNLLVSSTDADPAINGTAQAIALREDGRISARGADDFPAMTLSRGGTDGNVLSFYKVTTLVGSISVTTTATAFNTSSDYRLKEDVQPMVGASDRVLALNPVNFVWKVDGSRVDGFLAHEAQAVVPEAVTGEKDGEEMQAIDQSKLVPLLTAALQEALQKIDALEARITALEA
jgi:hypothetical protein